MSSQMLSEQTSETSFPGAHVLVVDDERTMRRSLMEVLRRVGYEVSGAASGYKALQYLSEREIDVVILDLKMPGMTGDEVLKEGRRIAPHAIFIILTAYGTLDTAIAGIRYGAHEYLLKPSPVSEILHTVESALIEHQQHLDRSNPIALLEEALTKLKETERASQAVANKANRFLQVDDITVDTARRLVVVRGEPADLTSTEFDILCYMMRHPGRVLSCREIVESIRDQDLDERDARLLLRSHVHRLRQKIEPDPADPTFIETVRGEGYVFTGQESALRS